MNKGKLIVEVEGEPMDLEVFLKRRSDERKRNKRIAKRSKKFDKLFAKEIRMGISTHLDYDSLPDEQPLQFAFIDKLDELSRKYGVENAIPAIQQLVNDGYIGLLSEYSCNYQICCRDKDYIKVCNALNIKPERQTKISYYSDLFTSLLAEFIEGDVELKTRSDFEWKRLKYEAQVHAACRHILSNLHRYQTYFINARSYTEKDFWLETLYHQVLKDKKQKTSR